MFLLFSDWITSLTHFGSRILTDPFLLPHLCLINIMAIYCIQGWRNELQCTYSVCGTIVCDAILFIIC